jgi:hypothetical protein
MKAETIIGLIVLVVVGLVIGILFSVYSPDKSFFNRESPPLETKAKEIQTPNFTGLVSTGQNMCEGCHLSGKRYIPQAYQVKQHAEGSAYCLECHKIDHNIHPMSPINKNVTCERCHGLTGHIPAFRNGTIACAECHDFPDPLKPSYGNLVVIHRPRNVDCAKCHLDASDSCLKCHNEIKSDKKWEKRLAHFNTILKTVRQQ